jgi:membrane-bound lytic murein transglycosylase B
MKYFAILSGILLLWPGLAVSASWGELVDRLEADGLPVLELRPVFERLEGGPDPAPMAEKIRGLYVRRFGSEKTRRLQEKLAELGYAPGPLDGRFGKKTRRALALFQKASGLRVDGRLSEELRETVMDSKLKAPPGMKAPKLPQRPAVYRSILTPVRLAEARGFFSENTALLAEIEDRYGVPGELAVGVLTVETRLGEYLGGAGAFKTLASMAASRDFSFIEHAFAQERLTRERKNWLQRRTRSKSEWAFAELKALIAYAAHAERHPLSMPGSCYGAIGISQFMPSNALAFGVDGDGDGKVDLFQVSDALHSMANFMLRNAGGGIHRSRYRQRRALFRYNPSRTYVNTVMAVADHLRETAGNDRL